MNIEIFDSKKIRYLKIDSEYIQSAISLDNPALPVLDYLKPMIQALKFINNPKKCCILGLGGGSLVHCLHAQEPNMQITAVDISPEIIQIAKKDFLLSELLEKTKESKLISIIQSDAFEYLQNTNLKNTDLFFVDLFLKDAAPEKLLQNQFYQDCWENLSDNGVLVINTIQKDLNQILYQLQYHFSCQTLCIPLKEYDNYVLFGFKNSHYTKLINQLTEDKSLIKTQLDSEFGLIAEDFV